MISDGIFKNVGLFFSEPCTNVIYDYLYFIIFYSNFNSHQIIAQELSGLIKNFILKLFTTLTVLCEHSISKMLSYKLQSVLNTTIRFH